MTTNHEYTPDIDDIIIAYHSYMSEDGTHSQDFEVSRVEVYRMIAIIEAAAEQRSAEAALRCVNEISMEHHEQTDDFPCTRCLTRAQEMIDEYRADQMEDNDETH